MGILEIKEKVYAALGDKAKTVYELAASMDLSVSSVSNYLNMLEAIGEVRKVKTRNKTRWVKVSNDKQD